MRKQSLVILLTVSILVVSAAIAWAQLGKNEPNVKSHSSITDGRYQLFQGQYTTVRDMPDLLPNVKTIGVFKIDTRTGRVWLYRAGETREGVLYSKWDATGN